MQSMQDRASGGTLASTPASNLFEVWIKYIWKDV